MQLYPRLGVSSPFDAYHRLVTPACSVSRPIALAIVRLTLAVYTLVTSIIVLATQAVDDPTDFRYFSYFTSLSYIGLCTYFWAAGVQTLLYARSGGKRYPLQNWPRPLQFLHLLLYSTVVTFPILVTIVFWVLLADSQTFATTFLSWSAISQHALNTAFALFEILATRIAPPPWLHLPFCVLLLACYLGVAYISHQTQGFYTYSFLDPTKEGPRLAAYIVGIALGECIIFALVRGICVLRHRYILRRDAGGRNDVYTPELIDDWQEIERPKTPIAI